MSFYSEFALYYEQVFPFREEVYAFLKGYAGEPGAAVLDIGCGPGHYCGRFARDGFVSTGIDLDARMIATAAASYPYASFHCMDMADAGCLQGPFGLVYSIGNVLFHLHPDRLAWFVAAVYALLDPGGCWVFQVVNREGLPGQGEYLFPVKVLGDGSVTFHRRYRDISPEQAVFEFSLMKGDVSVFSEGFTIYPTTSGRYRHLHEEAGFVSAGAYGGFDCSRFVPEKSGALVMIFRKER